MTTHENPYNAPNSDLESGTPNENITVYRKKLLPKWIKCFGWIFIVMGTLIPFVGLFSVVTGTEGEFSFYGLEATGTVFSFIPLMVIALFLAHGICAFGLLFGKSWGLISCIALAYTSIAVCVFTMFSGDEISLRLELLLLTPYLIKLHKLKPFWLTIPNTQS